MMVIVLVMMMMVIIMSIKVALLKDVVSEKEGYHIDDWTKRPKGSMGAGHDGSKQEGLNGVHTLPRSKEVPSSGRR